MADAETITIEGLAAVHEIIGVGEPVLLLHGWGANRSLVTPLATPLAAAGFRVYAPDLPGFGDSAAPPTAWTVFDYADWVQKYMDHLALERVHLFGHSFGGRLSLILGADATRRVSRIVLANSAGLRPQLPQSVRLRTQVYKGARNTLNSIGLSGVSEQLRQAYNARYGSSDFNALTGVMRQTFVNVINQDLLAYAQRVAAPTLLFWGDQDQETPLWMGQALEKAIPDAALIVHAGAGHYSYLDRLNDTARVMVHFFQN